LNIVTGTCPKKSALTFKTAFDSLTLLAFVSSPSPEYSAACGGMYDSATWTEVLATERWLATAKFHCLSLNLPHAASFDVSKCWPAADTCPQFTYSPKPFNKKRVFINQSNQ